MLQRRNSVSPYSLKYYELLFDKWLDPSSCTGLITALVVFLMLSLLCWHRRSQKRWWRSFFVPERARACVCVYVSHNFFRFTGISFSTFKLYWISICMYTFVVQWLFYFWELQKYIIQVVINVKINTNEMFFFSLYLILEYFYGCISFEPFLKSVKMLIISTEVKIIS